MLPPLSVGISEHIFRRNQHTYRSSEPTDTLRSPVVSSPPCPSGPIDNCCPSEPTDILSVGTNEHITRLAVSSGCFQL